MSRFRAACVQINASDDIAANLERIGDLVREARAAGADFITTPECAVMMAVGRDNARAKAQIESEHAGLAGFQALARETGAWLLAGSLTVKLEDDARLANRQFLIDPAGQIVARYSKIHMFDVNIADGTTYRESRTYRAGEQAVLARLPWGTLGLSICYDLRFPYLYRDLAKAGADFFVIPSAFTRPTGRAHWHVLQRARAIEHGCFVISAAQCGEHPGGRKTYGHSIIVGPWGDVLAEAGPDEEGAIVAEIDVAEIEKARGRVPSLEHDRAYAGPTLANPLKQAAE